uniref:Craniofacial development protein 2 n=1 Tax=Sipha flava TaxID=143950 RepID=A0A2S2QMB7_9HEMI
MWSGPPGWGFGDGLTTRPNKKTTVKKPPSTKPRIHVLPGIPSGNGKRKCKEIKIATWNTLSLYRTGACQNLADVLKEYNVTIAALQEVRWTGTGQVKINDYTIYFKGKNDSHQFGVGFAVNKDYEMCVKEFNPVSERICTIRLDTEPLNMFIINIHAPTEGKEDLIKEEFYEEITEIYDRAPKNTVRILIGDFHAKIGRETIYRPTIGLHSAHEQSNDNGQRSIAFATSRNMTISSTFFPHKDIHKYTWKSPDGNTFNQIDHVVIDKRFKSSISDIRSYRGADCDSDHFLVITKFRIKLKKVQEANNRIPKYNIEKLREEGENQKYVESLTEKLRANQTDKLETSGKWTIIRNTIIEAARKTLGEARKQAKKWYNNECQNAVLKNK